ncbi:unnamed protein product [Chironomus riparius]|uniref:Uncharacterized protein n=1 Tax=Chironomus riparius TaxID=315576 RepID=A0A9N9RPB0_9DIPT|nr:unnamed protein product [Chironomus riparius]
MFKRLGNMILLCLSISIIALCNAQELESKEMVEQSGSPTNDEERLQKQQETIEALMKEVGDMGMLLENYRRVIVSGIKGSNDVCGFIEALSSPNEVDDKTIESHALNNNDLGVNLYKQFFREINDPIMKTQIFATLENHLDDCYNSETRNVLFKQTQKRDKSQLQKIRFHSWGGKRNRGAPKIVIRTPFYPWGGKRSEQSDNST